MKTVKYLISLLLYYTGILDLVKKIWGKNLLAVLLYHRVIDLKRRNGSVPEMVVSPEMFEEQIKYLFKHYTIVSLDNFLEPNFWDVQTERPRVLITFDDGWHDNYLFAYPILKKYGVPALIFISTGFIGTNRIFWPEHFVQVLSYVLSNISDNLHYRKVLDLLGSFITKEKCKTIFVNSMKNVSDSKMFKELIECLKACSLSQIENLISELLKLLPEGQSFGEQDRLLLDWDEVKEMGKEFISFGAHTRNHVILDTVSKNEMQFEITASKQDIEKYAGFTTVSFAYPNGNYNDEILESVRNAGYKAAFTTEFGVNDSSTSPLRLRRIRVDDKLSKGLNGKFSKRLFEFEITRNIIRSKFGNN